MGQGTTFSKRPQRRIEAWRHYGDARGRLQQQPHFLQRGLAATGDENLGRVEMGEQGKVFHGSSPTSVSSSPSRSVSQMIWQERREVSAARGRASNSPSSS